MKNPDMLRLAIIVISAGAFIYLISMYKSNNNNNEHFFVDNGENTVAAPNQNNNNNNKGSNTPVQPSLGVGDQNLMNKSISEENNSIINDGNESSNQDSNAGNNTNENNNQNNVDHTRLPVECYPKDTLSAEDLLPGDSNSTWAQTVPAGQGSLGDQNFLNAGFHIGINTVGQSLRNANQQIRSEPANPQVKVSPWLQTTIEPDSNRKPLEISA